MDKINLNDNGFLTDGSNTLVNTKTNKFMTISTNWDPRAQAKRPNSTQTFNVIRDFNLILKTMLESRLNVNTFELDKVLMYFIKSNVTSIEVQEVTSPPTKIEHLKFVFSNVSGDKQELLWEEIFLALNKNASKFFEFLKKVKETGLCVLDMDNLIEFLEEQQKFVFNRRKTDTTPSIYVDLVNEDCSETQVILNLEDSDDESGDNNGNENQKRDSNNRENEGDKNREIEGNNSQEIERNNCQRKRNNSQEKGNSSQEKGNYSQEKEGNKRHWKDGSNRVETDGNRQEKYENTSQLKEGNTSREKEGNNSGKRNKNQESCINKIQKIEINQRLNGYKNKSKKSQKDDAIFVPTIDLEQLDLFKEIQQNQSISLTSILDGDDKSKATNTLNNGRCLLMR